MKLRDILWLLLAVVLVIIIEQSIERHAVEVKEQLKASLEPLNKTWPVIEAFRVRGENRTWVLIGDSTFLTTAGLKVVSEP